MSAAAYKVVAIELGGGMLPPVNAAQALRVRNALVRHFFTPHGFELPWSCDGNNGKPRTCWLSSKPTQAQNHSRGLGRLVHDISHGLFEATYGNTRRQHDPLHVQYEADMAEWVRERIPKWFAPPRVKSKPTAAQRHERALARTQAAIKRWESKAKRAATALRKLAVQRRRSERALFQATNRTDGTVCPNTHTTKKCNDQLCCY